MARHRATAAVRRYVNRLEENLGALDVVLSTQSNDVVGQVRTTGKLPLYMANGRFILATDVGEASLVLPDAWLRVTRTGDLGETGLFGGGRVAKDHVRVEAYGAVDELSSFLGLAVREVDDELGGRLRRVQGDLLSIGATLATPAPEEGGRAGAHIPDLPLTRIAEMEEWMDAAETEIAVLGPFGDAPSKDLQTIAAQVLVRRPRPLPPRPARARPKSR